MLILDSALVVRCTLPDSVISVVRDSTAFLNVKVGLLKWRTFKGTSACRQGLPLKLCFLALGVIL